jgi:hypothetical protein
MIACGIPIVAVTTMMGTTFGSRCCAMILLSVAPLPRAASTNSFSLREAA